MVKLLEYIWLDAEGGVRSKTRVVGDEEAPARWNYDGSSTGQAPTIASEVGLRPISTWPDPLRSVVEGRRCELVLCDMVDTSGAPLASNYRPAAVAAAADLSAGTAPWFGLEQEYYMMDAATGMPLGYTGQPQGEFYCGMSRGRALAEEHMAACLTAGLAICGMNSEVGPGQWEYQIGPVEGVAAADQLIVSRYLLVRLAERHGVRISFHPKPLPGYNGSGCHTNVSTAATRVVDAERRTGADEMLRILRNMDAAHAGLMASGAYGTDNHLRLTGTHETSEMGRFTWGVGNRSVSVRIGRDSWLAGGGYFEDRRPAANMNPYRVVGALMGYMV